MNKKIEEQLENASNIEMILQGEVIDGIENLKKRCDEKNKKVVKIKIRKMGDNKSPAVRKRPTIGIVKDNEQ